ncbi:MAG: efflux RND transporter periplasmic adaptor subunit [Desulfomonilaceae bacterium]
MKKKILPAVVFFLTISVAACWLHFKNGADTEGKVFVSGNIEATEVDLSFRIAGQIKSLPIEEGDRVEAGQVVATLDTDTLLAQKGAAQAEIGNARAVLDQFEEGTRVEEIEQARALYKSAESKMKNAKDEYDRYCGLIREKAISASTFDAKETTLKVATEEFKNCEERLRQLKNGPREQETRAARARLKRAEFELKRIQLDIEHSVLQTPVSAVVMVKSNELGEVVLPGATVATVAAIDEVWLKGYVGEQNLGKIKLGQKAEITTDTYPNKVYSGVVTFISPRAEFTPKNVQTMEERVKQVYRVKITIKNPKQELKIGMPAEGYILVNTEPVKKGRPQALGKSSS